MVHSTFFKKSVRGSTDEGINEVILGCLESHPIENDHFKRFLVKRCRSYQLEMTSRGARRLKLEWFP